MKPQNGSQSNTSGRVNLRSFTQASIYLTRLFVCLWELEFGSRMQGRSTDYKLIRKRQEICRSICECLSLYSVPIVSRRGLGSTKYHRTVWIRIRGKPEACRTVRYLCRCFPAELVLPRLLKVLRTVKSYAPTWGNFTGTCIHTFRTYLFIGSLALRRRVLIYSFRNTYLRTYPAT
jgi:hypothetical protein